jgi:hypothetical protein
MAAPWTPADVAALRALVAAGVKFAVIGRRLGRSASSCRAKASYHRIRHPRGWWGRQAV